MLGGVFVQYLCNRNESNGIFVFGTFKLDFFDNFFISFKRYCCPELTFEKMF